MHKEPDNNLCPGKCCDSAWNQKNVKYANVLCILYEFYGHIERWLFRLGIYSDFKERESMCIKFGRESIEWSIQDTRYKYFIAFRTKSYM